MTEVWAFGAPPSYTSAAMAPTQPQVRRRRRARRGTTARPVNTRLYRAAFLVAVVPLLLAAFTLTRPTGLAAPQLPPSFDTSDAVALTHQLVAEYPNRTPGSSGAVGAASWFADQLRPYGLESQTDIWTQNTLGLGRVTLRNLTAVVPGQSPLAIVIMAHRDDTGAGPGANDNASGTAALIELAREYAQPASDATQPVQAAHTLVFLSTDAGAWGSLGAVRFLRHTAYRGKIVAVINLDALAGSGPARIAIAGDRPRSPALSLVATAERRIAEQTGHEPDRTGLLGQLVDLAFPFTPYEQGPFVARQIPAITLTSGNNRPPAAFGDDAASLNRVRFEALGKSAQQLLASLDAGLELAQGTSSYVLIGQRALRGWALELLLVSLTFPFFVGVVDLFAFCRRRRIRLSPAATALRSRLAVWGFVGVVFTCFLGLGLWPHGDAEPPRLAGTVIGSWPTVTLMAFGVLAVLGWIVGRDRIVPRRPVHPDEHLAGHAVALLGLAVLALLVIATNPFALIFVLPALHLWLWLPQWSDRHVAVRLLVLAGGLVGPALVPISLGMRFGLGFDAFWYLVVLVAVGYVSFVPVVIALAGGAITGQLGAIAIGRYAPYPERGERRRLGPIRRTIRFAVLLRRDRQRRSFS